MGSRESEVVRDATQSPRRNPGAPAKPASWGEKADEAQGEGWIGDRLKSVPAPQRTEGEENTADGVFGLVSGRPSWDEYFTAIVREVGARSTCLRRQIGAVIVKDKRILATGYNGAPSGLAHCSEVGCLREASEVASGQRHELCRGLHAEQNAIIQAARHGVSITGALLYSSHQPCSLCAKMIINSGLVKVRYLEAYPDDLAVRLLGEAGVEQIQLP